MGTRLTITMTDRPRVKIDDETWPVFASARGDNYGPHDLGRYYEAIRNGEVDRYYLRVRRHADGRAIVYGMLKGSPEWGGEESRAGGEIVEAGGDIVEAIRRVGKDCGLPESVIRDCIADLPAERL